MRSDWFKVKESRESIEENASDDMLIIRLKQWLYLRMSCYDPETSIPRSIAMPKV